MSEARENDKAPDVAAVSPVHAAPGADPSPPTGLRQSAKPSVEAAAPGEEAKEAASVNVTRFNPWVAAILGSSLLGTFVSCYSACEVNNQTIAANERLAKIQSALQLQRDLLTEQLRPRLQAYQALSQTLNDVVESLDTLLSSVKIAQRGGTTKATHKRLLERLKAVGLALRKVIDAKNSASLNGAAVVKDVNQDIEDLKPVLAAAQQNLMGSLESLGELRGRTHELSIRASGEAAKLSQ